MSDGLDHARAAYIGASALAGAITSLSLMKWQSMSWPEILMTLFVGSAFATLAVPYLIQDVAGMNIAALRTACFWTYIGATGANAFIPVIIRSVRSKLSTVLEAIFGKEGAA